MAKILNFFIKRKEKDLIHQSDNQTIIELIDKIEQLKTEINSIIEEKNALENEIETYKQKSIKEMDLISQIKQQHNELIKENLKNTIVNLNDEKEHVENELKKEKHKREVLEQKLYPLTMQLAPMSASIQSSHTVEQEKYNEYIALLSNALQTPIVKLILVLIAILKRYDYQEEQIEKDNASSYTELNSSTQSNLNSIITVNEILNNSQFESLVPELKSSIQNLATVLNKIVKNAKEGYKFKTKTNINSISSFKNTFDSSYYRHPYIPTGGTEYVRGHMRFRNGQWEYVRPHTRRR